MEIPESIWARVEKSDGCWRWLGGHNSGGRPMVNLRRKPWYVYRLLYTAMVGEIPAGMTIDHLCQNGWCCNPEHCEPVPQSVNSRRAVITRYGDRDACFRGHPYATYRRVDSKGEKYCSGCARVRYLAWKARSVAQN
jgi:hypothetical protein